MKPLLVLNFKSFSSSTGENAVKLAKVAEAFGKKSKEFQVVLAPSFIDLPFVAKTCTNAWVFSQHLDPCLEGAFTGSVCLSTIKPFCQGTILNHAERKIPFSTLKKTTALCKEHGLKTLVCADSPQEAKQVATLCPDFLALEPPDLIGSGISVSTARPELVTDFIKVIKEVNKEQVVLVGAGITDSRDVARSLQLGAHGVLVASAFAKSKNPAEWLGSIQQLRLLR